MASVEIEFSLITLLNPPGLVEKILDEFEKQSKIRVKYRKLEWATAWSDLVKFAIYKDGPDVSEVGTTWVGDMVGMEAVRPLSRTDVFSIGGANAFLPSAWNSCMTADQRIWAVPWLSDTRVLYYRRDLLEKAGVDPVKAFQTHESLKTTLQRLQDGGIEYPWVIPTHRTRMTLHNVAAWVWGAGGDFISADGVHVTFQHPKALEGFRQYFELAKFIAPGAHELDDTQSDAMFWQGKSAVTISGPWLLRTPGIKPEVLGNIGVTFPPGIPWFGGSNLVIWQYSTHIRESLAFIRFITSKQVRETFMSDATMLPVRRDVLDSPSFADPRFEYLRKGLQTGRAFYLIHNWGMVEDRLSSVLSNIWTQIVQTPDLDLPALLEQELSNLARRLELAMGG